MQEKNAKMEKSGIIYFCYKKILTFNENAYIILTYFKRGIKYEVLSIML